MKTEFIHFQNIGELLDNSPQIIISGTMNRVKKNKLA
jgi:hypothetical protein